MFTIIDHIQPGLGERGRVIEVEVTLRYLPAIQQGLRLVIHRKEGGGFHVTCKPSTQ
ncbi:MAG TPA: hypothetical protein VFA07_12105 [Chthonomonadaceae bacterium]|nr:hypothetical protein [Chthonomonadaceae bacterium]